MKRCQDTVKVKNCFFVVWHIKRCLPLLGLTVEVAEAGFDTVEVSEKRWLQMIVVNYTFKITSADNISNRIACYIIRNFFYSMYTS